MTVAEARAILGPEVCALVEARVAALPPLPPEKVAELAALLGPVADVLRAETHCTRWR